MSTKLNDTQLVMLSAAAQRNDRCLVAPPNLMAGAARRMADKLIAAGLAKEVKAKAGMPVWRHDEEAGQSYALKLTAAGAKAVAVDPDDEAEPARDEERPHKDGDRSPALAQPGPATAGAFGASSPRAPRVGTKLALAVEMLRANEGATISELAEAMGWLPHTTRAVLTGLRKRGYALTFDRSDSRRGSTYRIEVNADAAHAGTPPLETDPVATAAGDGALGPSAPLARSERMKARRRSGSIKTSRAA